MDLLDRILQYNHWATTQLLDASRGLDDAQLDQDFDIGHRTLRDTFAHMTGAVDLWMRGMTGSDGTGIEDGRRDRTLAALQSHHDRSFAAFADFARRIQAEGRMDETFRDHWGAEMTFGGAIFQVLFHNEGHRTEASHMLRRLGFADLDDFDYGFWDFVRRGLV